MKKIGIFVLLIIVASITFVWLIKTPIFSKYLTDKMGVPVSIESMSILPRKTKIRNFQIDNPRGFKKDAAFEVNYTDLDYTLQNLFGDIVQFDQIALDGVYLNIEITKQDGSENNWTVIGSNLPKNENKTGKEVIIRKLVLTNITVEVSGLGSIASLAVPKRQYFDRWEFNEIDSRHGFPTEELIQKIFGKAGVLQYVQGIFNQAVKIKKALNPVRVLSSENRAVEVQKIP